MASEDDLKDYVGKKGGDLLDEGWTVDRFNVYEATVWLNSAMFNVTFDYVPHENRTDALAWVHAIGGVAVLLATLGESRLADHIEREGNRFLGLPAYPQQVFASISVVCLLGMTGYAFFLLREKKKKALAGR